MPELLWDKGDLTLKVFIQPKSSRDEIIGWIDNYIKIRITAPPTDNQANKHLCKFVGKQFGVAQSKVLITHGHKSRYKTLKILKASKVPSILGSIVPD